MDFGKLPSVDDVDFRLPPEPEDNARVLARYAGEASPMRLYVGCTGWGMKEWVGSVYPVGAKPKDFLRHYAAQFNTIEHNTTHYRVPDADTVRKWYEESSPDFRFCPKVPQSISHSRQLGLGEGQMMQFVEVIQGLREKLGVCFLQLPPYFGPDRMLLLEQFLAQYAPALPLAVELRHPDWFGQASNGERLFELLTRCHTGAVITDVAGRRDVLHGRVTAPFTLVRFVGNDLHPSDYDRLRHWAQRLALWQSLGLQEAYFFVHEPDNLRAPQAAAWFYEQVKMLPGIQTRGPVIPVGGHSPNSERQLKLF